MAYTPKEWQCGETITAEALNHMEQGIASSGGGAEPLIIRFTGETETVHDDFVGDINYNLVDKTPTEVFTALNGGRTVLLAKEQLGGMSLEFPMAFSDAGINFHGDLIVLPSGKLGMEQGGIG